MEFLTLLSHFRLYGSLTAVSAAQAFARSGSYLLFVESEFGSMHRLFTGRCRVDTTEGDYGYEIERVG